MTAVIIATDHALVAVTAAAGLPLATSGESLVFDFQNSAAGSCQVHWKGYPAFGAGKWEVWGSLVNDSSLFDAIPDTLTTADNAKLTIAWDLTGRTGLRFYKLKYTAPGGAPAGVWHAFAMGKGGEQ